MRDYDVERLKEIGKQVREKQTTWAKGAEEWNKETGDQLTGNAIKKRYYRFIKASERPPVPDVKLSTKNDKETKTEYSNGVVEGTMVVGSQEELFKKLKIDPHFNELVFFQRSKWQQREDGVWLYATKYRVKPLLEPKWNEKEFLQNVKDLIKSAPKNYNFNFESKGVKGLNKDKLMECPPVELHLGSLSWHGDTEFNYDSKIASDMFRDMIKQMIEKQEHEKCDKLIMCIGGDFFNSDTPDNTTTKGTPMHNDVRWKKMFETGVELWKSAIEELEKYFNEVEIRNVPGNHDRTTSYYLYSVLQARYEDRKKIKFGKHTRELQEMVWGDNLIVWAHGETNVKRLIESIDAEFRHLLSQTKRTEVHVGHLHSEMVMEKPGLLFRRNGTLKLTDYYEYHERFVGAVKKHQVYIWEKEKGLVNIYNVITSTSKQKVLK